MPGRISCCRRRPGARRTAPSPISERRISRQRPFLPLPGEAKSDWWIVTQVARRLGFAEAFNFDTAAAVFREHAALSAFENDGARDFDIGALAALSDEEINRL